MFSTDFIFRQQENLVDNQKFQAGFRPLCNKILMQSRKKGAKSLLSKYIYCGSPVEGRASNNTVENSIKIWLFNWYACLLFVFSCKTFLVQFIALQHKWQLWHLCAKVLTWIEFQVKGNPLHFSCFETANFKTVLKI